jgi:putative acetyltransferase
MIKYAHPEDFSFIYNLYMHPEVNRWLLYDPMDKESFMPIFDDLVIKRLLFIFQDEGKDMGMFKLQPMKYRNGHIVYLGGVAIDPVHKGQGMGARMMQEIVDKLRQTDFVRVELTVAVENEPAVSLYEKFGFKKEGVLEKYSYLANEGRYLDEHVMGLILKP